MSAEQEREYKAGFAAGNGQAKPDNLSSASMYWVRGYVAAKLAKGW